VADPHVFSQPGKTGDFRPAPSHEAPRPRFMTHAQRPKASSLPRRLWAPPACFSGALGILQKTWKAERPSPFRLHPSLILPPSSSSFHPSSFRLHPSTVPLWCSTRRDQPHPTTKRPLGAASPGAKQAATNDFRRDQILSNCQRAKLRPVSDSRHKSKRPWRQAGLLFPQSQAETKSKQHHDWRHRGARGARARLRACSTPEGIEGASVRFCCALFAFRLVCVRYVRAPH